MRIIEIGEQELCFDIPEGALITGAIGIVTFQYIEDGELMTASTWATGPMTDYAAIGLLRMTQLEVESLEEDDED